MSAFIVSRTTMVTVGAALGDKYVLGAACLAYDLTIPYGDRPKEVAQRNKVRVSVLKRWAEANRRAVSSRYDEETACPTVPRTFAPIPGDRSEWTAAIKALDCLEYQCAETVSPDAADVHRVDRVAMLCAKAAMVGNVLDSRDAFYSAARWD